MNIGVYVAYNSDFREVAAVTIPPLRAYCLRHGYHLGIYNDRIIKRDVIWDRVDMWEDNLHKHDWIVHLDADTLITNPDITFESILEGVSDEASFVVSKDINGLNDGVLFIRNDEFSKIVLEEVWSSYGEMNIHCAQDAFAGMLESGYIRPSLFHFVPQKQINAYAYREYGEYDQPGTWEVGDFILHLPGMGNNKRVELLKDALKLSYSADEAREFSLAAVP